MRCLLYPVLVFASLVACQSKKESAENHEHHTTAPATADADTLKKSLPKETHAMVGGAHITIKYTAPVVKGRVIWGGLVPYNEVWVTGAHRATLFEIDKNFIIGNQSIPAGRYAIFTIPGTETWTFILNKNWDQHLADDYKVSEDLLRITVTPEKLEETQERLLYAIKTISAKEGTLQISWEKIRITIPLKF
ncbi:MAG: DUF2911 domain-containing protein [Flammeovirgaceae bacterium]|nr:MAG: DUF2911 domain-containing protein [Flammeovirgaceae bacterium]